MTRDTAKEEWSKIIESGIINFNEKNLIDKIYDDFENRSCIGCINLKRSNSQDCISCSRQYQDNFKIIKNKDKITNF